MATARVAAGAVAVVLTLSGAAGAQQNHRIVGTWVPADRVVPSPLPLTATARRAIDEANATKSVNATEAADATQAAGAAEVADATDAPAQGLCAAPGMPALLDTAASVAITQQGDKILIRYAEWDATRTVYTNPRNGPPTQKPSAFGVSFGRWEGETLAIFTTYIAYAYFDRAGTPQSAAVTVLERYTPSSDGSRLESKVTVTDAATFTAPVVIAGSLTAVGATVAAATAVPSKPIASAPDGRAPDPSKPDPSAANAGVGAALVASRCVG